MKTITINVTQEDIDKGEHGDCEACPIAIALDRQTGLYWLVGDTCAHTDIGIELDLPLEAKRFISAFDEGRPVEPFSFEITI